MNFLLHRQRTPGKVIPVPNELKELMLEISREVLRAQPKSVIHFIADYLEAKLIRRENQVVADKVVDTVLDTSLDIINMLDEMGLNQEKAEQAVHMIRDAFQKHFKIRMSDEHLREAFREAEVLKRLIEECGFTESEALKAGKIIERAYKTYFLRNVYKDYHRPAVTSDWEEAAKHTLGIYAQSGATKEEMERAAVRIQATYRGYFTRKRQELDRKAAVIQEAYRKHQDKQITTEVLDQIIDDVIEPKFSAREEVLRILDMVLNEKPSRELTEETVNDAAIKIQSAYRGSKTRKEVMAMELPTAGPSNYSKERDEGISDPPPRISSEGSLEKAATLTQSLARGHLTRKKIQTEEAAIKIQSLARGHIARKQLSAAQSQQDK
ncbi:abnormal spindle-like microcephaly-associated protein homolog [Armigeres subalbatus]|uniref:abnormal spindle-like microcephaly-associated protein homolog n=1 Tax=Armigeres subalbatus TaxID=124917 RepID=UPI002ED03FFB